MNLSDVSIKVIGDDRTTDLSAFKQFSLNQSFFNHHSFELVIGHEVAEELGSHAMDKSKAWIGKPFEALFGNNIFLGIVTSVNMSHFHGLFGDLIIRGYSPTILLDSGPHSQSWNNKKLEDIVIAVCNDAKLTPFHKPQHVKEIVYMAQYKESCFDFLTRLAATYHEWFFYNGSQICFGKPDALTSVPLVYGTDLTNIELSMKMVPVNYGGYSYNAFKDETHASEAKKAVAGLNDMGSSAMAASDEAFTLSRQSPIFPRIAEKDRLDEVLHNQRSAAAAAMTWLNGYGSKKDLRPGMVVDLKAAVRTEGAWDSKPYGEYLVLNVSHTINSNYEYTNRFEAIPAGLKVLPQPFVSYPVAEAQLAKVLSNDDPDKQGRVQVEFFWQKDGMKSDWLRVMTPDAGKSDKVGQNRGHVFIPEKDDHVMVGFRYNDPMRPFVMGGMFNGTTAAGGGSGNKTKSIITRSGNTISFDDDKKSIRISDGNNCSVSLDGAGNISISSGSSITLSTGASSIEMLKDGTITIKGNAITINGADTTKMHSVGSSFETNPDNANTTSQNVSISGSTEVSINGGSKTSVSSTGKVALSGAQVTLN